MVRRTGSVKRQDLRLQQQERAKKERQLAQDQVSLAQTTRATRPQVKLLLREQGSLVLLVALNLLRGMATPRLGAADWPRSAGLRRLGRPPLLGPQVLLRLATGIPRVRVRARQCLLGPVPCAFFREISDDQKCNRAVRCGDCPISAQYRRRCSRRGLVGYGNTRSRLLHKRVRPAGTSPIVDADKCPSPLRRIED